MKYGRVGAAIGLLALAGTASAQGSPSGLPRDAAAGRVGPSVGKPEVVARFYGPSAVGCAVSHTGRIFLTFPHTLTNSTYCLAELRGGRPVPYPSARLTVLGQLPKAEALVSAQGITVDAQDRLWALDTGKIKDFPVSYGGPKLVCIDLKTNKVVKKILFPTSIAGPNAYLNDVRVDLAWGKAGTAFITDSSEQGPNGIVVVDLASGQSRRRLGDHPSAKAEPGFVATVEGQPLVKRPPTGGTKRDKTGSDGIALGGDGQRLFYCPNQGRHLYSVSITALVDPRATDDDVAATVKDYGAKPGASDGIEGDAEGGVYVSDYEHDAVERFSGGKYKIALRSPFLLWPDSIAIGPGGYVYVTSDQLGRQAKYHRGKNIQQRPFSLWRVKTGDRPVFLK